MCGLMLSHDHLIWFTQLIDRLLAFLDALVEALKDHPIPYGWELDSF